MYIGRTQLGVSLWCTYDTGECCEHLEEKSDDEEAETIHGQRKGSIRRRLTLHLDCSSTECGTQPEKRSDIPGPLLDIIVERIWVALLEIPQGGCTLPHLPNPQDYHPDEVEKQTNHGEELHARPMYRCVAFTTRSSSGVDDQRRRSRRGGTNSNGHPEGWPSFTIRSVNLCSTSVHSYCPRRLTSGSGSAPDAVHAAWLR